MSKPRSARARRINRMQARVFMRRLRNRASKAGWVATSFWVNARLLQQARERATMTGTHTNAVWRAAIEVGLRQLGNSAIIKAERDWRTVSGDPVAPRWKGRPFKRPAGLEQDPKTGRWRYRPKEATA